MCAHCGHLIRNFCTAYLFAETTRNMAIVRFHEQGAQARGRRGASEEQNSTRGTCVGRRMEET